MEKAIHLSKSKFLSFIVLILSILTSPLYAQQLVPFTQIYPDLEAGDEPIIRGDMRVIGNSVLGLVGDFDNQSFEANDEYNGPLSNNRAERGYIDIDSDISFNTLFTALPTAERNYIDPSIGNPENSVNEFGSPFNSPVATTTGTFSSSSAELSIRDENSDLGPGGIVCARVVRAFLYWGGIYPAESQVEGPNGTDVVTLERPDCDGCEHYTDVKILPPGGSEYFDIRESNSGADFTTANSNTSLQTRIIYDGSINGDRSFAVGAPTKDVPYACVADVTSLFTHLQEEGTPIEGNWTVANVRGTTGYRRNGSGAGWSLAVIYEDPLSSVQKNITFFDGFVNIENGQAPVDFPITGFETIATGPVNVDIATIGLEGDIGFPGDQFQIDNPNVGPTPDPNDDDPDDFIPLAPDGEDTNNFYNSSITTLEVPGVTLQRFPNSSNTLGYDSDHFSIDNGDNGNEYIQNSDDSADFRVRTIGDSYTNFFNAFAIDVIAPDLEVIKRAFRPDNSEFSETDEVDLGEEIVYEVIIRNGGNDDAVNISFVDVLPINTNFENLEVFLENELVPDNLITSEPTTATDELTGLSFNTTQISFNIADELLEIGESVRITFSVNVVEDCELLEDICTNRIQNIVDVSYFGAIDIENGVANPFLYEVQSAFDVNECEQPDFGPTVLLSDQSFCQNEVRERVFCDVAIALEGGLGFDEYQWFFEDQPLTRDANNNVIGPNDSTIIVGNTGTYRVEQLIDTNSEFSSCRDVLITFEVRLFDPLAELNNPLIGLGDPLEPACAIDGTPIIGIQLCNDPIDIPTNFPDDATLSWQRFDENSDCVQPSQNCPFTSPSSADCYAEISTDRTFTLSEEGSYLLTVTLFGGCTFNYYFDAVPIGIDPVLDATNPDCADEVVFTVSGVDFGDNLIDFELNFEITNNGNATTVPAEELVPGSGIFNALRIPRDPGEGFSVRGVVTTNIEGLCDFETDPISIDFIDLNLVTVVERQASCFFDTDTNDNFDPTRADIRATVEDNNPDGPAAASIATPYIFNLINTATTNVVQTSGSIDSNTFLFENVNPENTYEVEIFAFGNEDIAARDNCSFTAEVEELEVPLEFGFNPDIIELTCDPAEIDIELIIPSGLNEEDFTFTIPDISSNVFVGNQTIFIDDIINMPAVVVDDELLIVEADDGRIINFIDFTTNPDGLIRIVVNSPEPGCSTEQIIQISPFVAPSIAVESFENVTCEGDEDGSIIVSSLEAGPNPTYELVFGGSVIETQTSPIFLGLAEGEYTIRVLREIDNENNTVCTAEVIQSIGPASVFTAPVIDAPTFFCDANDVDVEITTLVTGGTGNLTYNLLRDGEIFNIFIDEDAITTDDVALGAIDAGPLLPGTYQLRVTDENFCEVISNEVVIQELEVSLSSNPNPPVASCSTLISGEPAAEVTITPTFSVTGVVSVDNYTIITSTVASLINTSAIDGVFLLPAGIHVIEASIPSTFPGCNETIEVVVDEIDLIEVSGTDDFVCPGADGELTFNILNSIDYEYTLVSDTAAITPIIATSTDSVLVITNPLPEGSYTITVVDNVTQCENTASVSVIAQPVVIDAVNDINLTCFGEPATIIVNPTDGNIAINEFSFEGPSITGTVTQASNQITVFPTGVSEVYTYTVRNTLTNCTETGSLTITQPEELELDLSDPQPVNCSGFDANGENGIPQLGSYNFSISGGIIGASYTYRLFSEDDLITEIANITVLNVAGTNMTGTFPNLDAGGYVVTIEDDSTLNCFYSIDPIEFRILPQPLEGEFTSSFTTFTCADGVTLFFEVEEGTGSLDGNLFTIAENIFTADADFVDPTTNTTDNIFQIGDSDFPLTQLEIDGGALPGFSQSNIDNGRVFAITGLDFDIEDGLAVILDTATGCRYTAQYETDASPSFEVVANPIQAGACDPVSSGSVELLVSDIRLPDPLTPSTTSDTTVTIEVFSVEDEDTILNTPINLIIPLGATNVPTTVSGLPAGTLRVRVQDQNTDCNATTTFEIEIADPLNAPIFSPVPEDCDDPAMLTNLAGNGGTPPYRFALSNAGATIPADGDFQNVTELDPSAFVDVNNDIDVTLWILDANGCSNSADIQLEDYVALNPDNVIGLNDCIVNQGSRIVINDTSAWEGRPPYFYNVVGLGNDFIEITPAPTAAAPFIIPVPSEGDFDVLFRDSLECPATLNITVPTNDFELNIPNDTPLDCINDGVITVEITNGGIATDTYSFVITEFTDISGVVSNPNTPGENNTPSLAGVFTDNFTLNDPGLYVFTVTNTRTQCEFSISRNVEVREQIGIIALDDTLDCFEDSTGEIEFNILNFEGALDYQIVNTAVTPNTTDASGTITDFDTTDFSLATFTPTTGGTPVIDLITGAITVPGINAGTFNVTLTAGTSASPFCTVTEEVLVTQPDELSIVANEIVPLSCVNESAEITSTVTGGNGEFTYELLRDGVSIASNDTGVFIEDIIEVTIDNDPTTGNNYVIRVTDRNNCTVDSDPIFISHPISPEISVTINEIQCNGDSGSFNVLLTNAAIITADNTSIRYSVFVEDTSQPDNRGAQVVTPQANAIINNIFPGDYIVVAEDALGCVGTFNVTMPDVEPVEFDDPILVAGVTCNPTTAEFTLTATGGRPDAINGYTFQEFDNFISEGGVAIGTAATGLSIPVLGNGQLFFMVTDSNGCDDFITFNAPEPPAPVEFVLDRTIDPLCFGEATGFVDVVEGSVSGGVGNFVYNLYTGTTATGTPLSETSTPPVIRVGISAFNNLLPGTYTYEVVSGTGENTCTETETFTIGEFDQLLLEDPILTEIGCPGDDDATATLMVTPGISTGSFTYTLIKDDEVFGLPIEVEDGTPAVFEFLSPCGDDVTNCYEYFVTDNGTGCTVSPDEGFNIAPKDPLSVILDEANSAPPICKEDVDGTRVYDVTGGTPPYRYILLDNPADARPTAEEIINGGIEVPATNQISLTGLIGDTPYRLFVSDAGNGLTGEDLITCDPFELEFDFETEDLDLFDVVTTPNCDDGTYTVGIINLTNLEDEDISIQLFERALDGTDGIQITQVAIDGTTLALEEVPAGNYNVYIESVNGCATTEPFRQILNLEEFEPVMFVNTDVGGGRVQPFVSTNEINVFQLLVTGGVNPNGINPYRFEGTFSAIEPGAPAGIVEIDNDGRFTIDQAGFYTFTVFDNFADGVASCSDTSNSIGINLIDIDIPNVFNPSSDFSRTNTWFPENLTADFSNGVSPIIGDGEPQIPGIITTTDSTVTGGTTTGGTTTSGITTGGNISGGSLPTTVPSIIDEFGNTITYVTSGNFVIETITNTSGTTSVTIFENAIVVGDELITNVNTISQPAISETTANGDTVFTITTDGTTTGGTTEGGVTTGGTTTFVNTSTFDNEPGSFVTTGGTTENGTTTGGITTGGTTTVITVPNGGGTATVTTSTGTTVTNGTTTGGTTTGGTTANGNVTGGISSTPEPIEFLDYENMEVLVFDRYGRQLDEFRGIRTKDGTGAEEGWDGTYQGKEMPSGDYWYLIKLNDREGREFTGHFTLYRRN